MAPQKIKGVIVPLLTPFDKAGHINTEAVGALVDFLIAKGVRGVFPGGTTGEGPLLRRQERFQLAETVISAARGRIPVIVHTGGITTEETTALTQHAREAGAYAAAIVPPFFYRYSDDALFSHFQAVATHVPDFPIYLYDNPAVSGNGLSTALAARLVEACPSIVGIKDSSGALDTLTAATTWRDGAFNTASGPDGLMLAASSVGVDACVSGNANFVPELVVALKTAATQGDMASARRHQLALNGVRRIVRDGADLSLFKGILKRRGLDVGTVRAPLPQASEALIAACWEQLLALGLELPPV